jgi:NitT/TauT family transport system ATP-binding protein
MTPALAVSHQRDVGDAGLVDNVGILAVELRGVALRYDNGVDALTDLNLVLREGEFLSVVGPSGCGKSTLLKLISGLVAPTRGEVFVRGQRVDRTPQGVGLMFQRDALLPWATVRGNIEVGFDCSHRPPPARARRLEELLTLLGLSGFGDEYPRSLSGGMRQRVALGRLLAYAPDIYLMDEPFGALDAQTKLAMGDELLDIWSRYRKAVIFVTHDIEEAVSLSDRVVVMSGRPGHIKAEYHVALDRPRSLRGVRKTRVFHDLVDAIWNDVAPAAGART